MTPPLLVPSAELRWVLLRAFADPSVGFKEPIVAARALTLASQLDLAARIATRQPHDQLVSELGAEDARRFHLLRLRVLALNGVLERTTGLVVDCAAKLGIAVVLLKHSALRAAGIVAAGARDARDVDVLVDDDAAQALQRELGARGFRAYASAHTAQHLPSLARGPGEVVEVHHSMWGLSLQEANATPSRVASELIAEGYAIPCAGAHVPLPELLTAYAVVHGLVQHRNAPGTYPTFRILSDLCDLGSAQLEGGTYQRLVSPRLSASSLEAVRDLVSAVESGIDPRELAGPALELLSHLVAGALDPDYQSAMLLDGWNIVTAIRTRFSGFALSRPRSPPLPTDRLRASARSEMFRLFNSFAESCLAYARLKSRRGRPMYV